MRNADAAKWNTRYEQEGRKWLARRPRALLRTFAHLLPDRGLALDAAAGVGVNSLFLAERGMKVIAADISEVALGFAIRQARARWLSVAAVVCDLSAPHFPNECFDVIVNFRFLERAALASYRYALKPSGLLIFETFVAPKANSDVPRHYLRPGELMSHFGDWEIVLNDLVGSRTSERVSEQLIARKPPQDQG